MNCVTFSLSSMFVMQFYVKYNMDFFISFLTATIVSLMFAQLSIIVQHYYVIPYPFLDLWGTSLHFWKCVEKFSPDLSTFNCFFKCECALVCQSVFFCVLRKFQTRLTSVRFQEISLDKYIYKRISPIARRYTCELLLLSRYRKKSGEKFRPCYTKATNFSGTMLKYQN